MAKAKRGDLVAIVTTAHTFTIGAADVNTTQAMHNAPEHTRVELAAVTSVTRDGIVKAARTEHGGTLDLTRPNARRRVLVVPAATIDVGRALSEYATRRYPSAPHSSMVPPFDSIEEARAFLRPFLTTAAA